MWIRRKDLPQRSRISFSGRIERVVVVAPVRRKTAGRAPSPASSVAKSQKSPRCQISSASRIRSATEAGNFPCVVCDDGDSHAAFFHHRTARGLRKEICASGKIRGSWKTYVEHRSRACAEPDRVRTRETRGGTRARNGARASDIIKLASNENPLGPSPKALAAMRDALERAHFYPDGGGWAPPRRHRRQARPRPRERGAGQRVE